MANSNTRRKKILIANKRRKKDCERDETHGGKKIMGGQAKLKKKTRRKNYENGKCKENSKTKKRFNMNEDRDDKSWRRGAP